MPPPRQFYFYSIISRLPVLDANYILPNMVGPVIETISLAPRGPEVVASKQFFYSTFSHERTIESLKISLL